MVSWLKCEFMQDRVGESFDGLVTAATSFGLFIELTDIYVEGLLHITALPADYYNFDAVHHCLTGERSGRKFRLGDPVRVQVARVDLDDRKIDFEMATDQQQPEPDRKVSASRAVREKLLAEARQAAGDGKKQGKSGARNASGKSGSGSSRKPAKPGASAAKPGSRKPAGNKSDAGSRGPRKRKSK